MKSFEDLEVYKKHLIFQ